MTQLISTYYLANYGIKNKELAWFSNYLKRSQFVLTDNFKSDLLKMLMGIPQGSILGPLLFLIFINDLPAAVAMLSFLFADDCTFQLGGPDLLALISRVNVELAKAQEWFVSNKLTLNTVKTKYVIFEGKDKTVSVPFILPDIRIGGDVIQRVGATQQEKSVRFLGIWVDDQLTFMNHLGKLKSKLSSVLYALAISRDNSQLRIRKLVYFSLFESQLRFGAVLMGSAPQKLLDEISVIQRKAIRLVAQAKYNAHSDPLFTKLGILKFDDILKLERLTIAHKYKHGKLPLAFTKDFLKSVDIENLERRQDVHCFKKLTDCPAAYLRYPINLITQTWNSQYITLKSIADPQEFKEEFTKTTVASYNSVCTVENCFICPQSYED